MNTVGRTGRLGADIRCVVSVAMLTEGWDTNNVTHVLGVCAFGTQLLCEQVVGRALRRKSYDLNAEGLFDPEYADVFGIPFEFTAAPAVAKPVAPKPSTRVEAVKARAALEIRFPRVQGYRVDQPDERIHATFTPDSRFEINAANVGPCKVFVQGVVGRGVMMNADVLKTIRPSSNSPPDPPSQRQGLRSVVPYIAFGFPALADPMTVISRDHRNHHAVVVHLRRTFGKPDIGGRHHYVAGEAV